jgi:hypothetical protein
MCSPSPPLPLYSGTHWVGGWVGPRARLDAMANKESIVQPVLSLYWLSYFGSKTWAGSRPCVIFYYKLLLWWGIVSHWLNSQSGGPPLIGCPRLLIRHIRSYPPYLEAVSSIRSPPEDAPCHGDGDPHNMMMMILSIEIQLMWNIKCFVIPVISGASGTVTKD